MDSTAAKFRHLWKPVAVVAALGFLYAGVLTKLGYDWWTDENYSHGLLVPLVIGFIVFVEFDGLKRAAGKPLFRSGGAVILLALAMLLAGTLGAELFMQRISLLVMLAGIVLYFFGGRVLRLLAAPFVLLFLSIPIPQIVFNKIAFPLQIWASQLAVWTIRTSGVAAVRKGNIIEILPQGALQVISLEVVEACSGIRSLMTLMALALVLAYFTGDQTEKRPADGFGFLKNFDFWRAAVLLAAAVPIAIVTNAGRVAATGILTYYYGKRATEGLLHASAGWIVFITAFIILIGINFALIYGRRLTAETNG